MASPVVLESGRTDVVIDQTAAPVVRFAAEEMTNFLSRALSAPVPIVTTPRDGRTAIILGVNAWSKAEGIDPATRPHDTYLIRTGKDRVFILGTDSQTGNPRQTIHEFARGTLHGVYAFLEQFANCRFYFPGELGEIVPKVPMIVVPETELAATPAFLVRTLWNTGDGAWPTGGGAIGMNGKALNWMRLRLSSTSLPCCHGASRMGLLKKYKETHPEYFALDSDGTRHIGLKLTSGFARNGHLCFSNPGTRDAIYAECLERFKKGAKFVDIMPNDGYPECHCADCQKAYRKGDKDYATELIWSYTADLANRLKRDGVAGKLTQMAYGPYGRIPEFDLPDNLAVMVAVGGPWSKPDARAREYARVRGWAKKTGGSVWIWTYPRKADATRIKGLPDVAPRAHGEYYKGLADAIFGSFLNSDTDEWINHYFNYYLFSRVCWNPSVDIDATIAEHHRLMFGAAADELAAVYDRLERTWLEKVVGNSVDTAIGPIVTPPSERDIWTTVYSPAFRGELRVLFDAAAKKVPAGSLEARRIAFFRRYYLDLMEEGAADWKARVREIESHRWNPSRGPLELVRYGGDKKNPEPQETSVSARLTEKEFVFTFDCAEQDVANILVAQRPHDDQWLWQDSSIAVLLNPSGDRKTYCQIMVNANGDVSDVKGIKAGRGNPASDWKWESHARTKVTKRADGYVIEVAVPRTVLTELGCTGRLLPAEFMRVRAMKSGQGLGYYKWSAYSTNVLDIETWGLLELP